MVRNLIVKRPGIANFIALLVGGAVTGGALLVNFDQAHAIVAGPVVTLVLQQFLQAIQNVETKQVVDQVAHQTNGAMTAQIQDVKQHVSKVVAPTMLDALAQASHLKQLTPQEKVLLAQASDILRNHHGPGDYDQEIGAVIHAELEVNPTGAEHEQLVSAEDHLRWIDTITATDPDVIMLKVGDRVYDNSFARPGALRLRQNGSGDIRYLSGGYPGKDLTRAEAQSLFQGGVPICALVFETTANRANAGYAAGVTDAKIAEAEASQLGYPVSMPIYFTVDENVSPSVVASYFAGVVSVLATRAGTYGSYAIINAQFTKWLWQTCAWSGNAIHPAAHLYQRRGETHPIAGTDENVVMRPHPAWIPKAYQHAA